MTLSVCFTNFGPYHLARLDALAKLLAQSGDRLIAYEVADQEERYPWNRCRDERPFEWITLFPGRTLESISRGEAARAMTGALGRDLPDAVGIVGYSRPESLAALAWARMKFRPAILMSESQEIDHPRAWWKEAAKGLVVRRFSAALVGGPRHRDYLIKLGQPGSRIALGYNAVDNHAFAHRVRMARRVPESLKGLPEKPYFLAVNRFVPEKNLPMLIRAYARYRDQAPRGQAWDLVLCGAGPDAPAIEEAIRRSGSEGSVHRPGFLQVEEQAPWLAFASAFVHPSALEPWGLVVNEAAASGLPLIVSDRAGCVETLVPDPEGTTGVRFDPTDEQELASRLSWMAGLTEEERQAMGRRAAEVVNEWGPLRFAQGMEEAMGKAGVRRTRVASNESFHRALLANPRGDRE